jgi:tol-pal system protein YbgF
MTRWRTESGKPWTGSPGRESLQKRQQRLSFPLLIALGAALGAFGLAACATTPRPAPQLAEMERTILELRSRNAGYFRRMDELENRIAILEDQLDRRKATADQRAPAAVPTRVLRADPISATPAAPSSETPGVAAPVPPDDGPNVVQTTIVAEHAVDYAGDAAQLGVDTRLATSPTSTRWPTLTGAGTGAPRRQMLRLSANQTNKTNKKMDSIGGRRAPEPRQASRHVAAGGATMGSLKIYREAVGTLQRGRPEVALAGFRRFLEENPGHEYADNALYWIGDSHYNQRQFREAERAFRRLIERYPRGNKVPYAMLKLGLTLQALADDKGSRAILERLARAFPNHEAARLAIAQLAQAKQQPTARADGTAGSHAGDNEPGRTLGTVVPVLSPPPGVNTGAEPTAREVSR